VFTAANGGYLIGTFDGKTFTTDGQSTRADYGTNYDAVQTYSDISAADGRRIQISWMDGGKYHTWKDQPIKAGGNLLKDVAGGLYDIQMQVDLADAKSLVIKCRGQAVTYSAEKQRGFVGQLFKERTGFGQEAVEPSGGAPTHGQQAALVVLAVADEQGACGILHNLSVTLY